MINMHLFRTDTQEERQKKSLNTFVSLKRAYVLEIEMRLQALEKKAGIKNNYKNLGDLI